MLWDGQWDLMELTDNKVNFGVGILPKMYDKPMTIALGEPIVAFASTKHPKEAWELQKAFMNPDNIVGLIEGGLWMPVLKDWYEMRIWSISGRQEMTHIRMAILMLL